MKIVIDKLTRELMGWTEGDTTDDDKEVIDIGNRVINGRIRRVDPEGNIIPGTVFTQEQIDAWKAKSSDRQTRRQKIIDELQTLVGLNVTTMTDGQRWKLVGVLLYAHGIINGAGNVLPLSEWDILE